MNIFVKIIKKRQTQKQTKKQDETNKITNSNLIKLSNGDIAMFSLFISCRKFGISKSDSQIRKIVELTFSVKHLPTMLKIFSLIKPQAMILGIKVDEDHLDYYLNLYLKRYIKKDMILSNKIKRHLRTVAHVLPGTDEAKARNAVKIVLAGICNKNV
jgi:hypothetical protein